MKTINDVRSDTHNGGNGVNTANTVKTKGKTGLMSLENSTASTSKELQVIDTMVPGRDLNAYITAVNGIAVLSAEEEQELANQYYYEDNLDAARKLVLAHLRFVVHMAKSYSGYGLSEADLIQEGNVGLMKAVKRFNPEVGVRLVSFAVHWIKAEMHEFILRNWRIVKVATTKAQRKLFFNLRGSKKRLGWLSQAEAEAVASDLGVDAARSCRWKVAWEPMMPPLTAPPMPMTTKPTRHQPSILKMSVLIRRVQLKPTITRRHRQMACMWPWKTWMIAVAISCSAAGSMMTRRPCMSWLMNMVFPPSVFASWKKMP